MYAILIFIFSYLLLQKTCSSAGFFFGCVRHPLDDFKKKLTPSPLSLKEREGQFVQNCLIAVL
jgi:hypothetical protein